MDKKIVATTRFKKTWNRYFPGFLIVILPIALCLGVTNFALMPAIMFPAFICFMLLLNMIFYKGTESIEFVGNKVLVNKKETYKFTLGQYEVQKFRFKTNWEGLKISSDDSVAYIYETDFEKNEWRMFMKIICTNGIIKKELLEFYGDSPKDEIIRSKPKYQ